MTHPVSKPLPVTVNLHTLVPCNYRCGFCHSGFISAKRKTIPKLELHQIIRQIAQTPQLTGSQPRKVTFAGGEPLLSSSLVEDVQFAHSHGLVTSLVTNGSLLTEERIYGLAPVLDWLTISIDSLDLETNRRIGRSGYNGPLSEAEYLSKIQLAKTLGIRVKVNTVVNRLNAHEDFTCFMRKAQPLRWKILQATRIEEENGEDFDRWGVSEEEFKMFSARHSSLEESGIVLVPETQDEIYGSYAMVAPNGCFFDNSKRTHQYSQPIVSVGIEAAWAEINFSVERFRQRHGEYDFVSGLNIKKEVC
ncbi:MAG: radical SAM protein [Verrucomicrobia bacterium]|nr:radical SAM protein [Verrucomicrobiota bacterium]